MPSVDRRMQALFVWGAPVATILWVTGWGAIARFIPPLSPSADAAAIKDFYDAHSVGIRIGACLTMIGAAFIAPFCAAVSAQLRRIEGEGGSGMMAQCQFGLGILGIPFFIFPCFFVGAAAFRPEYAPQIVQIMNDIAWLPFVGAFQTTSMQMVCIGMCILAYRDQRVFPRWLGYYCLFEALALFSTAFILFFKTGPLAWDGLLGFWLTLAGYCGWFFIMFWTTRRAIKEQP